MRLALALVFFSSLGLCGCLSTVRVKSGPTGATANSQKYDNVPGIPFYTKIAMCKEETVWTEFQPTNQDLQTLLSLLNKSDAAADPDVDIPKIDAAWDALNAHPDYVPLSIPEDQIAQSSNAMLVSNTSAPEAVVDYANAYYLNAPRPWVGSSQIDEKLNTDGTLTEGSALCRARRSRPS
jgi:hypothetical protein